MLRLAGVSRADFVRQMRAFRDGTRAATVMQQIAKGYTEEQTEQLGEFFAAQR
jgi:cytochrome c553